MPSECIRVLERLSFHDSGNGDLGVWLKGNKHTLAFVEGMDCQGGAYVTVYENDNKGAHDVVIGVQDGRPFLQVVRDGVGSKRVDLLDFINHNTDPE